MEGDIVGTPAYMAPEQAMGHLELLGPRTDIYSVGALLYQLLTGQPPYIKPGTKASPAIVLAWVIDGPPTPIKELAPKVPDELVAICEKAMAREPKDRYASMLDMAEDDGDKLSINEPLTHKDIAQMVGSSREMVSRIFKDLVSGGYITVEQKRITINQTLPSAW